MSPDPKHGYYLEDLAVGMFHEVSHTVTEKDVDDFARICGDYNPIHMDEDYASKTPFGGRIAHGALTASYISAILGNDLPGPGAIFMTLELKFRAPVRIGDTVIARAEVGDINERRGKVAMKVQCSVAGKVVVKGVAGVMVEKRPVAE
ncbi:MAG: MaoC family dehydratase [Robiginitomaculum sp.]|nr:MaoC family dehydratase [Robiginitomaculum sp.]MDQ7076503.1 MaoC family dehydratase [Robiginitomaculum sp.]